MRRILVDHARKKASVKRSALDQEQSLTSIEVQEDYFDLLLLDKIMTDLSEFDERKSRLAELHYFGGLNHEESANVMGVSLRTAQRELQQAKAWIHAELSTAH